MRLNIKNEYLRNILTLILGTGIAQLIPILILPVLTRLYTPSDFGVFGVFIGVTSILGIVASAKYDVAIMQPISDYDADQVFKLSIFISSTIVCFLYIVLFLFSNILKGTTDYYEVFYLIPITVLIISFNSSFTFLLNRKKHYNQMSKNKILQSILIGVISLTFGYIDFGYMGLIIGYVVGNLFVTLLLYFKYWKDIEKANRISILNMARVYNHYPLFGLPSSISNTMASQIPIILIGKIFNESISGFYYLVDKILSAPISLLAVSIGSVFRQHGQEEKNTIGNYNKIYILTLKKLIMMGLPIFTIIGVFGKEIFSFAFGVEWIEVGLYAQILAPMFFLKFIISPLLFSFHISNKLEIDLVGQIIYVLSIFCAIFIGYLLSDALVTIILISIAGSLFYLSFFYITYNYSKTITEIKNDSYN
ncbi:oligosaccharide flippase family protein [Aliarcobacter butzleri]|uniref:oligosaccharide flippase family protein n=1 Tax=Aliarcobacter butzleri TaxID=28197 RepID=UPI003AF5576A